MSKKNVLLKMAPVPMEIALYESRTAMYSGWKGELRFKSLAWGEVYIKGPGFTQGHADLIDFARLYYRNIRFDGADRPTLSISFADFARFKGVKPDSATHRKQLLDFYNTDIQLTLPDGHVIIFKICDRADYMVPMPPNHKPIPPREGKIRKDDEVREHNKECVPRPEDSLFEFRLSAEFLEFIGSSMCVDYSLLLRDVVKLPDTLKRAARFFLSHHNWKCNTESLCGHIFPNHANENKDTRSRRRKTLRNGAAKLKKLCGIEYDSEKDYWRYMQHSKVKITLPRSEYKALPAPLIQDLEVTYQEDELYSEPLPAF